MNIEIGFDSVQDVLYCDAIRHILSTILPEALFRQGETDPDARLDQREHFEALLPIMHSTSADKAPANLTFHLLYRSRGQSF